MATPWDRAASGYVDEWVPRFVPYHLDLIREAAIAEGSRVLVTSSGPGAEVLAAARAVGEKGSIRATDKSGEMVRICIEQVKKAGFETRVSCAVADAIDASGGPYDVILCAFGLWQLEDRAAVLRAWSRALNESGGKIGVITWGPADKEDPFEILRDSLAELEPDYAVPRPYMLAEREAMTSMFEDAGLSMVRHTVVRHTLSFPKAEMFVKALREACTWRKVWEDIGDARIERVAARFYSKIGGLETPISFAPAATLAIAGLPGAELELAHRPSVRVPAIKA